MTKHLHVPHAIHRRRLLVLGQHTPAGRSALAVARAHAEAFDAVGVSASRSEPDALTHAVMSTPADVVVNACPGTTGLTASLAAVGMGAVVVLADSDIAVSSGGLLGRVAASDQVIHAGPRIRSLCECLRAGDRDEVCAVTLVIPDRRGDGGDAADAAGLPSDGPAAVDARTGMDVGLDLIAARSITAIPYRRIHVAVGGQDRVAALATFRDGATVVRLGPPGRDQAMAAALAWPRRLAPPDGPAVQDAQQGLWEWSLRPAERADAPAVACARAAGRAGGLAGVALNAANKRAVAAFTSGSLPFPAIIEVLERIVDESGAVCGEPGSVQDVLDARRWAQERADRMIDDLVR